RPTATAGVTVRETLTDTAKYTLMTLTPGNGSAFQRRLTAGGTTLYTPGPVVTAPYWVRLLRVGDLFQSYVSADGAAWYLVGTENVAIATYVYAGLAVSSAK